MKKSSIIFKNQHYTACAMRNGLLIVTSNSKQYGKMLTGQAAQDWINHINTALDSAESHAMCRAIVNS